MEQSTPKTTEAAASSFTIQEVPKAEDLRDSITFGNDHKQIGKLSFPDSVMTFEGDADESAKMFFDAVCQYWNKKFASEFQRGRTSFAESYLLMPVEMKRDKHGFWSHPEIPWSFFGEDVNFEKMFDALGFDATYTQAEFEVEDEDLEKMTEALDFNGWVPKVPNDQDGWFLISIADTDNGVTACWLRKP